MLKDVDDKPIEPVRRKAERRWRNHDVEKRLKEERAKPTPKEPKELEVGDVFSRDKPDRRGSVIRSQTKFAKSIKGMLDDHKHENERKNVLMYVLSIRMQRYRLLKEKLRRLEAREAERVAQQKRGTIQW
jgi:hypothetical protein